MREVIDLKVPYREREDAKLLGAKWNQKERVWYITSNMQLLNFERWLPEPLKEQVKLERLKREEEYKRLEQEWKTWKELPSRYDDIKQLLDELGFVPVKVSYGFCPVCDSRITNGWCHRHEDGTLIELCHYSDRVGSMIRPIEYKMLISYLEHNPPKSNWWQKLTRRGWVWRNDI